jgi:hypothetical protein
MASEDQCYEEVGPLRSMVEIAALFFWRSAAGAHRFVFMPPPACLGMGDSDRISIAPGMQWIID